MFPWSCPTNWTPDFASFGDYTGYDLQLGKQFAQQRQGADLLAFIRDYLISNPHVLAEYNRLKTQHAG